MENIPSVGSLLKKYGISPKKSLGQNFLSSGFYLEKIVQAAAVTEHSRVLEIGPGLGGLTRYLAASAGWVTAVELDSKLVEILQIELQDVPNVKVIHGDILAVPLDQLELADGYVVVANIPYYITSAIIRRLLEGAI